MQQVDIVQSRMSLHCSRGKCNYILAPSCAHSLLEKKANITFSFFQPLVYVHNQMYKCRLLITFENSSGPTKSSHENACMCRLVSAFAAREKCSVSFSAPICVFNLLLSLSRQYTVDGQYIPSLFIEPEVRHDKTSYWHF